MIREFTLDESSLEVKLAKDTIGKYIAVMSFYVYYLIRDTADIVINIEEESNGLVNNNDEAVYTQKILNAYDVLEIGNSKFLFLPFCRQHFTWEEIKPQE